MFRFFILIALLTVPVLSRADTAIGPRTTQGFKSYAESTSGAQFSCEKQCFIMFDKLGSGDYLSWSGTVSGSGSIGYGFLNGQQIIPGEFRSVVSGMTMNEKMLFSNNQYYPQIPKEFPIVIVVNGNIMSQSLSIRLGSLSFGEMMARNWERFSKTENFTQSTINLLYGYSVWGTSLTWILSLLFFVVILGIVSVYSFDRRRFFAPVFFVGMAFVVLYDLREHVNLSEVRNGYNDDYANVSVLERKNWFGIGYYPDLLDKASRYVSHAPVGQKIYLAAIQNFPLFGYSQYHLHPAETVFVEDMKTVGSAKKWDIFIRYGSPLSVADGWETIYASRDGDSALYIKQ